MREVEMMRVVNAMYEAVVDNYTADDIDDMVFCTQCPYAEICAKSELYLGCSVWEDAMGDDL